MRVRILRERYSVGRREEIRGVEVEVFPSAYAVPDFATIEGQSVLFCYAGMNDFPGDDGEAVDCGAAMAVIGRKSGRVLRVEGPFEPGIGAALRGASFNRRQTNPILRALGRRASVLGGDMHFEIVERILLDVADLRARAVGRSWTLIARVGDDDVRIGMDVSPAVATRALSSLGYEPAPERPTLYPPDIWAAFLPTSTPARAGMLAAVLAELGADDGDVAGLGGGIVSRVTMVVDWGRLFDESVGGLAWIGP